MPSSRRWSSSEKRAIGARQAWRCAKCAQLLPATYECDHVKPLHLGGPDCAKTNAEALCCACHASKTLDERLALEAAIRSARAEAAELVVPLPTRKPLSGRRPLLDPTIGPEVVQNRFLRFGYTRPAQS